MRRVFVAVTVVAVLFSLVAPAGATHNPEHEEFDETVVYEWEPNPDNDYGSGVICAHGICISGAWTIPFDQGFRIIVNYFNDPNNPNPPPKCSTVEVIGNPSATVNWTLFGGGYKQGLQPQAGCAFVQPHYLGAGGGPSTYLVHEGYAPYGCQVSELDGRGTVGGTSGQETYDKFVTVGTCSRIMKQTKWWNPVWGEMEGQVTINLADANGYATQTVTVNMKATESTLEPAETIELDLGVLSGQAWSLSEPPTIFVDSDLDPSWETAIINATCGWNRAGSALPMFYGGVKDMSVLDPDRPFVGLQPEALANVPAGEVWVTWETEAQIGSRATGHMDREGLVSNGMVSLNIEQPWYATSTSHTSDPDCGESEIVPQGTHDLQTVVLHELGHVVGIMEDLCSDPIDCGNNPGAVFWPAANCSAGVPDPTDIFSGYTMCHDTRQADGNDPAHHRTFEPYEEQFIRDKY